MSQVSKLSYILYCRLAIFTVPSCFSETAAHSELTCTHCHRALGTLRHQDSSALNYSAEVSGHFGTGAEMSDGHFGTDLYETLRHHCIFVYSNAFRSVCCTLILNTKTNTCHQNFIIHVVFLYNVRLCEVIGKKSRGTKTDLS